MHSPIRWMRTLILTLAMLAVSLPTTPALASAPVNDDFDLAIDIPSLGYTVTGLDTTQATNATSDPQNCSDTGTSYRSVWYKYTSDVNMQITANTSGSTYNTVLSVWTGTRDALTSVACNDDAAAGVTYSEVTFTASSGTTYYFMVASYFANSGSLTFSVGGTPLGPANDGFANATHIPSLPWSTIGYTADASTAPDDPAGCLGGNATTSVWYRYTPDADMRIHADTIGSGYDTVLSVWTGSRGALTQVACNDDTAGHWRLSAVNFTATAGVTYYFLIRDKDTGGGSLNFRVEEFTALEGDNFSNPIWLDGLSYSTEIDTSWATKEPSDPSDCGGYSGDNTYSVWLEYIPSGDMLFEADTFDSGYDTVLSVWTGSSGALTQVACNDDAAGHGVQSSVAFNATRGVTYYFLVTGKGSGGILHFSFVGTLLAPANDNFANATEIPSLPYINYDVSSLAATTETDDPTSCFGAANSIWFKYTPSANMRIEADTNTNYSYDTVLSVWTGSRGALTQVACNDNDYIYTTSRVEFIAMAGTTYYFMVADRWGGGGGYTVLNVYGYPASRLAFTTPARTLTAGTVSDVMTVQLQDVGGTPIPAGAGGVTVQLSSDSTAAHTFYSDAAGTTAITSVTIAAGENSASFYYMDAAADTLTITAAAPSLTSAAQTQGSSVTLADVDAFPGKTIPSLPYILGDLDTTNATKDATTDQLPVCTYPGPGGSGATVWFTYTPGVNMVIEANTSGSNYDTVLSVWTGSRGALTSVACNDNGAANFTSAVEFTATAGTTYYFMVSSFSSHGPGGSLTFSVSSTSTTTDVSTTTVAPDAEVTYSAEEQPVTLTATVSGSQPVDAGTVTFTVKSGDTVIGTPPAAVNLDSSGQASTIYKIPAETAAGTYTIEAGYSGGTSGNYTFTSSSGTSSLTIDPASQSSLTLTVPASLTYGATGMATNSGGSGTGTVSYDGGDSTGCTVDAVSGLITVTNASGTCAITATKAGDGNYDPASDGPKPVTLVKAEAVITVTGYSVVYDGSSHTASGTATGVASEDLSSLLDLSGTTHIDVGTYPDSWSFVGTDNYNSTSSTVTNTISPATATITISDTTKTYDGTAKGVTLTTDPSGLATSVVYSQGSTVVDPPINAGSYDVTVTITDPNYTGSATGALTIAKADPTCTVTGYSVTYDGQPHMATGSCLGVDGQAILSGLDLSATAHTDVGTYTDTWSFTDSTGNYNDASHSVTDTITEADQTITFDALTDKTYGDADFQVSATASSGLAVSFGVGATDQCTLAYDDLTGTWSVHLTGAGSCTVTAFQYGNSNYNAATPVAHTFAITPKPVVITPDADQSKVYGAAEPLLTFSNDAGLGAADFTGALSRDPGENVGTYAITFSDLSAGPNYTLMLASPAVTFAITPKGATVTADAKSMVYGEADPAFTYTVTGLLDGDSLSGVSCGVTVEHVNAGSYPITCAGNTNSNYAVSYVDGTLTVGQAKLTVTVVDASKVYGEANPDFSVSYAGFITGDDASMLGGTLGFSTAATVGSPVGDYAVTASGLTSTNYEITYVDGTLTITKATPTLSINWADSTYIGTAYAASATVIGIDNQPIDGASVTLAYYAGSDTSGTALVGPPTDVGTYTVEAVFNGNDNYTANSATKTITISKATLTVTAVDKSMAYGDAFPTFTSTITGFVATDTESVVSGAVAYSTDPVASSDSPAGNYAIVPDVSGLSATNYTFTADNGTLAIAKRQATVVYTGDNYIAIPEPGSAPVNLSAKVSRNGNLGDLSLAVVEFTVKKFNGDVQTTVTATVDASGNAATTASVPTSDDPYTVEVQIDPDNTYWTSGVEVDALQVIVGYGTGRTAGGGWVPDAENDINGKSTFAFNVQNAKKGIKGNSLFIYRLREGSDEVQYVVKSNSWQGGGLTFNVNKDPARATFTGRATVQRYVNGELDTTFSSGNYTFTVDVFDGDLQSPRVADNYAITVRDSSNAIVKQLGTRSLPLTLGGGNVLVQSE